MPKIVQEVIFEQKMAEVLKQKKQQRDDTSAKIPPTKMNESKPKCECNVRNILKEFVKYLR